MSSASAEPIELLHEDAALAVVNKPAGLMVHDSALARGERTFLADRLRAQLDRRIHLVHRLDRPTSGCLLVAFEPAAASALGRQMMARGIERDYLAVVRGWPAEEQFEVTRPLDGGPGRREEKPALTRIRVLGQGELDEPAAGFPTSRYALVACRPYSGRFRQIRRHLRHAGHPVIGDTSHGDGRRNRIFRARGVHRMLLHAARIRFDHPLDGARVEVRAGLDAAFDRAMALFGWSLPDEYLAAVAAVPNAAQ